MKDLRLILMMTLLSCLFYIGIVTEVTWVATIFWIVFYYMFLLSLTAVFYSFIIPRTPITKIKAKLAKDWLCLDENLLLKPFSILFKFTSVIALYEYGSIVDLCVLATMLFMLTVYEVRMRRDVIRRLDINKTIDRYFLKE